MIMIAQKPWEDVKVKDVFVTLTSRSVYLKNGFTPVYIKNAFSFIA